MNDEIAMRTLTMEGKDTTGGPDSELSPSNIYDRLVHFLDSSRARYRVIHHEPEGQTERVSALRGHDPAAAAKCMVVLVKLGKKVTRFVLCVIPGDRKVDLPAVQKIYHGTFVRFADTELAERLAQAQTGTILPFAFSKDLELVVDRRLEGTDQIFFNAGRLDRSIALATEDYFRMAQPRIESISRE